MCLAETGDRTGGCDGTEAFDVLVVDDAGPAEGASCCLAGEIVHVGLCGEGAFHGKADNAALIAYLVDEVAATADTA